MSEADRELPARTAAALDRFGELETLKTQRRDQTEYIDMFISGADHERARIVAWLRAQGDRLCLDCPCYDAAASAIERGEHEMSEP